MFTGAALPCAARPTHPKPASLVTTHTTPNTHGYQPVGHSTGPRYHLNRQAGCRDAAKPARDKLAPYVTLLPLSPTTSIAAYPLNPRHRRTQSDRRHKDAPFSTHQHLSTQAADRRPHDHCRLPTGIIIADSEQPNNPTHTPPNMSTLTPRHPIPLHNPTPSRTICRSHTHTLTTRHTPHPPHTESIRAQF